MRVCWLHAWVLALAPGFVGFGANALGQPANDLCEDCMVIAPADLPLFFGGVMNNTATDDIDVSCNDPASPVTRFGLWYCFTPAQDCRLRIEVLTSEPGQVAAVFTGPACATLSEIACAEPFGGSTGDAVHVTAGVTYRILVGEWSSSTTPDPTPLSFRFHCFDPIPLPFFEDFENPGGPAELPEGWAVSGFPEVLWHIAENGECLSETRMGAYNHGPEVCDYDTGDNNLGRLKSPPLAMTGDPPFTLLFDYKRVVDPLGNDNTCVLIVMADNSATDTLACPIDNSGTLQFAQMDIPSPNFWRGREVRIEFSLFADSFSFNTPGWFVDNVEVLNSGPGPANDRCTDATVVCPGPYDGSTSGSSNDGSSSCDPSPWDVNRDVWFRYTPSSSGTLTADTCGSTLDTVLSVYSGCPGNEIDELTCNDDSPACGASSSQSQVTLTVTGGTTYYIRVSGNGSASGAFVLNLSGPACSDPTIPTVSEFGAVVMVLLLVTGGTLVFGRRRVRRGETCRAGRCPDLSGC
ncbi:MAG: hypothetical protein V3W34_13650 [Phycisphaerae bacterium]